MRRSLIALAAVLTVTAPALVSAQSPAPSGAPGPVTLRVMSFNIWGGGANEGKPIDETVAAIRAAGADIIGIQETRLEPETCTATVCPATGDSVAAAIAEALGYHVYEQTATNEALWANAIISRWPIGAPTANDLGVAIDVAGHPVHAFNIHLDDEPYGPYQVVGIEYGPAPFVERETEAIEFARATRGAAIDLLREDVRAAAGSEAAFLFGDFNEPSHLDWSQAAVEAGRQPMAVAWPATIAVEAMGFRDAFRAVHPDPVALPGFTWTPTSEVTDPEDKHDRIDFVFVRGETVTIDDAAIVGESAENAGVVVAPWPSDHRAVVAEVTIGG